MGYKELSIAVLESALNEVLSNNKIQVIEKEIKLLSGMKKLDNKNEKRLYLLKSFLRENESSRIFFERGSFLTWIGLTDFSEDFILDKYKKLINGETK